MATGWIKTIDLPGSQGSAEYHTDRFVIETDEKGNTILKRSTQNYMPYYEGGDLKGHAAQGWSEPEIVIDISSVMDDLGIEVRNTILTLKEQKILEDADMLVEQIITNWENQMHSYIESKYPSWTRESLMAKFVDPRTSQEMKDAILKVWDWSEQIAIYWMTCAQQLISGMTPEDISFYLTQFDESNPKITLTSLMVDQIEQNMKIVEVKE
jgi:hypothetical protein